MIRANFTNGYSTATAPGLYQWDYGQILEIHGLSLPPAVEVHFAIVQSADDATIRIGTTIDKVTRVAIPEFIVEQSGDAVAYIYISDTESGKTVKKVNMPITARQKPEAFDAPEDAQLFREAIEAVNSAADRSEDAEKSSEAWAHGHKEYPDRDEDNAAYYANLAHDNATSTSKDKKSVEETADSVNNIAMRVNADKEESEQYRLQAAQSAAAALESENNSKASENASKKAMEEARIAEGQAELFAGQSENSADMAEQAKNLVMQIGREVTENKEYVDKKIDDFNILHQQAIEDINNAGSGQIESINIAGQKALENIGTGIDPTFTQEGKAADAAATGAVIDELKGDLGNASNELNMIRAQACIFVNESDILGVQVDYKNKTFTRLAGAKNLTAGADFDKFSMYGGRKRCNVSDGGTINAYYGDEGYTEDGSNGQVMVYQPKFYYLVCPLEYDRQETGYGYHLRKANYYVSETQRAGFKLHPAFYDKNGNEVDYILMSAYEGCIYDTSANAYLKNDEQVADFNNDKFASIAGARPASGLTQNFTRPNIEQMAKNRGEGWHSFGIKTASMEQLLMIVEMGMMNLQTAIGQGVVSITDNSSQSCASFTGSTIGNDTGEAVSSKDYAGTVQTASDKKSICYRGVENFWGNIWKFVYGVNIWGNGKMAGGMPYICSDFNYAESKNTDNYEGAGFTVTKSNGYISAMGYSTKYDWLFMASECIGNSSLPVGDYTYITENLNGYRITQLGGAWNYGSNAGGFSWLLNSGVGIRYRTVGGRLVYVPTKDSAVYNAAIASWKEQMAA